MTIGRIPSVEGGIQPTIVDAKGDLLVATAADTVSRLAVGTNDYVLTAASGETTGLKWAPVTAPTTSWTAYTATTSNITVGNGTLITEYFKQGTFVAVRLTFRLGSTSSIGGAGYFSLPFAASDASRGVTSFAHFYDDSANMPFGAMVYVSGTTNMYFRALRSDGTYVNSADFSSTVPFTWATDDGIILQFVYEAA